MSSSKLTTPRPRGPLALIGPAAAVVLYSGMGPSFLQAASPAARQDQRKKYALLVGCTEYRKLDKQQQLWGPANDVPLYRELLTNLEGFAQANVTVLVGWPEEPEKRPTYANIVAAFEDLVAKAGAETQIFILLAGHGVQVPVPESQDPLDRSNPEPDGMDEVFLPADVESWGPSGLDTALSDNQIRECLTQMRSKGADVWIVFDCCHSGTMTKGAEQVERPRTVPSQDLGIPHDAIESAVRRARLAADERAGGESRFEGGALGLRADKDSRGSVVAFYAAQEWETTPELPRPRGAPQTKDHYFGLLSYTLIKCLQQRRSQMTYRELGQLLVARYRADRRSRGPTPSFEGDLDREVLGQVVRPGSDIILERVGGRLRVNAGELSSLTLGSILVVHPPANDGQDPKTILGHVKVVSLTPVNAQVEFCAFGGKPKVPAYKLPELARCEIVYRDFGDMRVNLVVGQPPDPKDSEQVELTQNITATLDLLSERVVPLVNISTNEATAEWVLRVITPEQALRVYGLQIDGPQVMLFQGEGLELDLRAAPASERDRSVAKVNVRKIFGQYAAKDPKRMAEEIGRDLSKIFTWQNVWRIAGTMGNTGTAGTTEHDTGLVFDVVKLKQPGDAGEPLTDTFVEPGQILEYRFRNGGYEDLWVAAVYLNANFEIEVYFSRSLEAGTSLRLTVRITDKSLGADGREVASTGAEGMVVFVVPMAACRHEPDYAFLAQEPLGVIDTRSWGTPKGTESPFEMLMRAATPTDYGTRAAAIVIAPSNPTVLSQSWITVPAAESE